MEIPAGIHNTTAKHVQVLMEIESVINSRPITYVSSDGLEEPLTPSHLLTGRRPMDFPDHLCREPETYESTPPCHLHLLSGQLLLLSGQLLVLFQ